VTAAAAQRRIYINENLTENSRGLLEKANQKRKDGLLKSIWTLDGKIFLKTSPDVASHAVVFRGVVLLSSPTAWEATPDGAPI